MRHAWRTLNFFRPDWPRIVLAVLLLLATTALGLLKPWPLALILDQVLGGKPFPTRWASWFAAKSEDRHLGYLVLLLVGFHLGHAILQAVQNGLVIQLGLRGLTRVRAAVFDWLLRLSAQRWNAVPQGELIYRATWDTYSFQTLFNQGLFSVASAITQVVTMTWVMVQLNVPLTLAALGTVPVLLVVMRIFGVRMARLAAVAQAADATLASRIQQAVTNLLLIQSYVRETTESNQFQSSLNDSKIARWRQHRSEVGYLTSVAAVLGCGTAFLVWLGARQVLAGLLTVGGLWVFLAYLSQLYEPLNQLSQLGTTIANALAGTRRVLDLLGEPNPVVDGSRPWVPLGGQAPRISFSDVQFSYDNHHQVLNDVSLEIQPGEAVAIIGPSGSGKTTLMQSIPRFLEPTAGVIRLDGVNLREYQRRSLREGIAVLLQEPLLLPTTIAENIAFGRPEASREEIIEAARSAQADGFIRGLAQGYDTVVGDGAARLSVGEKQRLNLARAFLKNAPILLLDEPTSALDPESEALVMEAIRALTRGRTTLMVAHRRATLRIADRVLALRDGRIKEVDKAGLYDASYAGDE